MDDLAQSKTAWESFLAESFEPEKQAALQRSIIESVRPVLESCQADSDARVFVITSGGTLVAMEKNAVRFVSNFSTGGRGSKLVEALLGEKPAESSNRVIFVSRREALMPYQRELTDKKDLDFWAAGGGDSAVERFKKAQHMWSSARSSGRLTIVPFDTVAEYLFALQIVAEQATAVGAKSDKETPELRPVDSRTVIVCAAAVSDYFIPRSEMAEHKISGVDPDGKFRVAFSPVPKTLGLLTHVWAPRAVLVTFKLETHPVQLIEKAIKNIQKYGLRFVVANQLQTYKTEAKLMVACSSDAEFQDLMGKKDGAEEVPGHDNKPPVVAYQMNGDVEALLAARLVQLSQ